MENLQLINKVIIEPNNPPDNKRIFLSNIDLSLVVYHESVSFFDPPSNEISFPESYNSLYTALGKLLVHYDFFAGRLVPSSEDNSRFEIECNGAGVVVAAVKTNYTLDQLGVLVTPKPEYGQLVAFLHDDNEQEIEIHDKPLLYLQITQFECGSLALASRYNHCVLDGFAVREFEQNLANLTRGDEMVIMPNSDRTIFKARNPPKISFPHYEYSKGRETDKLFTMCGRMSLEHSVSQNKTHLIHISPKRISELKKKALQDGKLKKCSSFQVVAAKIWKARSIATKTPDEMDSMMLFPVDVRKLVIPKTPSGFAGNALIPGFAKASLNDLKEREDSYLVKKVQEGIERLNDEYIKSGIDWLEVHRGVPSMENSFSLVAWSRLGLEEDVFSWGKLKCAAPILLKPGLVMVLPGSEADGGLIVCLELPDDQMEEFKLLLEC